jgi:hypothetical protein
MGRSASITCYPAKIPHFFENLQILAFYAILFTTSSIVFESFIRAISVGFQRMAIRQALVSIYGLNGLRLVLYMSFLYHSLRAFPWRQSL